MDTLGGKTCLLELVTKMDVLSAAANCCDSDFGQILYARW